jgi:hypothetical protein
MLISRQPGFPSWLKRVQALCCLLPLLAGQTEVLPALLAIAAAVEGSHTTYAGVTPEGFRLVLSHERGQAGRADFLAGHQPANRLHRHGFAAKVICTLAGSTQKLADHDACFSASGAAQHSKRDLRFGPPGNAGAFVSFISPTALNVLVSTQFKSAPPYHQRVTGPHTVQALRTIVLLI